MGAFSPITIVAFIGAALFGFGVANESRAPLIARYGVIPLFVILFAFVARVRKNERLQSFLQKVTADHNLKLADMMKGRAGWFIFIASALGLYLELMLVRWHSSSLFIFNFFKNVSLLACFLGLGIGYSRRADTPVNTPLVLPAIALQFIVLYVIRFTDLQHALNNPIPEHLIMGTGQAQTLGRFALIYGFFCLMFLSTAVTFIPLGHLASTFMDREEKLTAYGWNLAGSLFGMLVFSALAWIWAPPAVWLAVGALGLCYFFTRSPMSLVLSGVSVVVALAAISVPVRIDSQDIYSPYQLITLHTYAERPTDIEANHLFYQRMFDFKKAECDPYAKDSFIGYSKPYKMKPSPNDVLIVGSGTGNDVSAGLANNAGHIDAVEIDPAILKYGELLHPSRPYQDTRVTKIVNDARTYIRRTQKKYDLIVYGLLDSHTLLSSFSSVRLDSFVYTVNAFREARARLKDDGVLSLSFCVLSPMQGRKIYEMLKVAFDGQEPLVSENIFFSGPGVKSLSTMPYVVTDQDKSYADSTVKVDVSTDNWPFLYMPVRKYPISYVVLMGFLLVLSLLIVSQFKSDGATPLSSPVFFFLGAGFMLLETKNITELGLVLGNNWFVIVIVISCLLLMAFLSNLLVMKLKGLSARVGYVLLGSALLLNYFCPTTIFSRFPLSVEKTLAALFFSLPFLFSGLTFSAELRRLKNTSISSALASNLLGAMLGGFCEYNSMYFGYRSLYVFAMGFYVLAFASSERSSA